MIEVLLKSWYLVTANPLTNCIFNDFQGILSEVIVSINFFIVEVLESEIVPLIVVHLLLSRYW